MCNKEQGYYQDSITTKGEWVAYTGSDEQIAELKNANNGYVIRYANNKISNIAWNDCIKNSQFVDWVNGERHCPTHYWIIPDDPLREMKIRQAMTKQPTWIKRNDLGGVISMTTSPDWNIPNAEYNFTAFEDTPK